MYIIFSPIECYNVQGISDSIGSLMLMPHGQAVFMVSCITRKLRMYKRLLPGNDKVPVILLGDLAYPLLPYCMKEYPCNEVITINVPNMLHTCL